MSPTFIEVLPARFGYILVVTMGTDEVVRKVRSPLDLNQEVHAKLVGQELQQILLEMVRKEKYDKDPKA